MVSLQAIQATPKSTEPTSSPRISFSAEFLDNGDFISITPNPTPAEKANHNAQFEFLSSNLNTQSMITADELFSEGKLLPFWKIQDSEERRKPGLKERDSKEMEEEEEGGDEEEVKQKKEESRLSWFVDDDPSPRLPKCTVLWKELLRLKKQRPCSLSPSSSSSSSSSSSVGDLAAVDDGKVKRAKKGLERTRSGSRSTIMRPMAMINVPICTQGKNNPPLFSNKKGRVER